MGQFFEELGQAALAIANVDLESLLVYAEVCDGVISADIFFKPIHSTSVQFCFAPPPMREQIYEFWSDGGVNSPPKSWTAMEYVVRNGKFTADFKYAEDFSPGEDLHDRRPRVVAAIFPGDPVDYSGPR